MAKKQLTNIEKKRRAFVKEKIILSIIKYILLFAPIVTLVIINRERYFTYKDGLSMSIGCMLALIVAICLIKGQSSLFKGIWKYVVIFALCYLLQVLIQDAVWISACALIGYFLSMWFTSPIERRKKLIEAIDTSTINAEAMSNVTLNVISK